jgi:hypothetical protein
MNSENKTWIVLPASSGSMSIVDKISFVIMWWSALVFRYAFHLIHMSLVVFNCCARVCIPADDRQSLKSARQVDLLTSSPWRRTVAVLGGSGCAARRRFVRLIWLRAAFALFAVRACLLACLCQCRLAAGSHWSAPLDGAGGRASARQRDSRRTNVESKSPRWTTLLLCCCVSEAAVHGL